jgi:hypothetical protein
MANRKHEHGGDWYKGGGWWHFRCVQLRWRHAFDKLDGAVDAKGTSTSVGGGGSGGATAVSASYAAHTTINATIGQYVVEQRTSRCTCGTVSCFCRRAAYTAIDATVGQYVVEQRISCSARVQGIFIVLVYSMSLPIHFSPPLFPILLLTNTFVFFS